MITDASSHTASLRSGASAPDGDGGRTARAFGFTRRQYRWLLRSISLLLACGMAWSSRFSLDPDGMSYVDLARCYLRGDWQNALSSYWSPLYPWLLAIGIAIMHPSPEWLIPLTHGLCLLIFLGVLAAWEWLFREWEISNGPPRNWLLVDTAGYLLITWTGLELGGVDFSSADDAVIAFLCAAAALVLRIRRDPGGSRSYRLLGAVLAFGFFSKAAFQGAVPPILLILYLSRSGWKNLALCAGTTGALVLLFAVPLSLAKSRPTLSSVGQVNYSWQVTGYGVEGYKEESLPAPPGIPHPIRGLLEHPRVLSFEEHLVGTTPVHFDPAWWCEGYPVRVNWHRQWMVIRQNVPEVLSQFAQAPALWFALVAYPFCFRRVWRRIGSLWYLWLPAAVMTGGYCCVFILSRYTCAPFSIFGFVLIAAAWEAHVPRWVTVAGTLLIFGLSAYSLRTELDGVRSTVQELRGEQEADDSFILHAYHRMKGEGFQPGDRAGVIGLSLGHQYLQLLGGQEVATVPARIYHLDDEWGRPLEFSWEKPDEFWRAGAEEKSKVFAAMRGAGAKWVFASQVPGWADVAGWTPVTEENDLRYDENKQTLFFRKL